MMLEKMYCRTWPCVRLFRGTLKKTDIFPTLDAVWKSNSLIKDLNNSYLWEEWNWAKVISKKSCSHSLLARKGDIYSFLIWTMFLTSVYSDMIGKRSYYLSCSITVTKQSCLRLLLNESAYTQHKNFADSLRVSGQLPANRGCLSLSWTRWECFAWRAGLARKRTTIIITYTYWQVSSL